MTFKNPKQYNSVAKDLKNVDHRKNKKIYMEKLNYLWGILNQKIEKDVFQNKIFAIKGASIKTSNSTCTSKTKQYFRSLLNYIV